jgi:osmoprotectant transport system ATP-binding protein
MSGAPIDAPAIIELAGVVKRFGSVTAVGGVSFAVRRGEACVLVGPSGCGKTTTLKMVNRVIEPSEGTIRVRGIDTAAADPVALRRSIGYVIQQVGLFPHMSVGENIGVALRLTGHGKEERRRRAFELLDLVGLDRGLIDRRPAQLSGGQQQRVGVARALAGDPDIVLMDEPFGAVDPLLRPQLQHELKRIQQRLGKTVLLVTHDLAEALVLADRLIVMKGGRVEQDGDPADILLRPATAFVRDFFVDVRGLHVLRRRKVGDSVELGLTPKPDYRRVDADASLMELLATCRDSAGPVPEGFAIADGGTTVGALSSRGLLSHVAAALATGGRP